ncbi:hypothetical protein (plasmid) [Acinetobacter baumannii]|nr:hypothetical protein ABTJ_p0030 [Acinetobacter baumannii MDR-TJ]QZX59192.1 hypothetical protein [Acinetobacter baumannii]QZX59300.1 hypothetical protein [Acinetobacter baumannii]QZX59810.1 hypothetical protein [Acinetobacter baumannii]
MASTVHVVNLHEYLVDYIEDQVKQLRCCGQLDLITD